MLSFALRRVRGASLVAALSLIAVAAAAAAHGAPSTAKIVIHGSTSFKANQYLKLNDSFVPGTITIRSGGTVTVNNITTDGHTLSLVKKSQVPRTAAQLNNCKVCGPLFAAHGFNPNAPGPPKHPLVNVGAPGFNQPGDSIAIGPPKSHHNKVSFKVTAKRRTTLYFICIFHPWMQGQITVK
jgi:plastocyanin